MVAKQGYAPCSRAYRARVLLLYDMAKVVLVAVNPRVGLSMDRLQSGGAVVVTLYIPDFLNDQGYGFTIRNEGHRPKMERYRGVGPLHHVWSTRMLAVKHQ